MEITDVRIRMVQKEDTKLKAVASITIDNCFVVHDIKVIEGKERLFIAMPSRKTAEGEFKDIAKGRYWFEKAAEHGFDMAIFADALGVDSLLCGKLKAAAPAKI